MAPGRRSRGERGPAGPPGPAGPEGPSGTSEARFTQVDEADVPRCTEPDLADCPNLQSVLLSRGSWVVQAKLTAFGDVADNQCGLVTGDTTTVDLVRPVQSEITNRAARFSLAAVVTLDEPEGRSAMHKGRPARFHGGQPRPDRDLSRQGRQFLGSRTDASRRGVPTTLGAGTGLR